MKKNIFIIALLLCSIATNSYAEASFSTSSITEYAGSKSSKQTIGRWSVLETVIKQRMTLVIYKQNGSYFATGMSTGVERLKKQGNRYYVIGAQYGDYYQVDGKGNLKIGDRDGIISTFRATKL